MMAADRLYSCSAVRLDKSPRLFSRSIDRIALIGNFLPRLCGLATFTSDVYAAMRSRFPAIAVDVYAMNDPGRSYAYPAAVKFSIDHDKPFTYLTAGNRINASAPDVVWLQHEFGIFGGPAGKYILALLNSVTAPVAVTLHTVLETPSAEQREVMDGLIDRASVLIVMARKAKEILQRVYAVPSAQIAVIEHGVPDRPFTEPADAKAGLGLAGHDVIMTFGLLSPGKGIESMINALPSIIAAKPDLLYLIVGATHPHLIAHEGEAYRDRLKARAMELGVADHIRWVNRFISHDELMDYLAAADIYVTPYLNPAQITSGTLSYALALGKAIVSTPYIHAVELLEGAHGVLVDFEDSKGLAREMTRLLLNPAQRNTLRGKAYTHGRGMIWPRFAERSLNVLKAIAPTERLALADESTNPSRAESCFEGPPADLQEEVA